MKMTERLKDKDVKTRIWEVQNPNATYEQIGRGLRTINVKYILNWLHTLRA